MDTISAKANISVARGCGFGLLAIVCLMVGLLHDVAISMKAGGCALMLMSAILLLKARRAGVKPYKHTELWLLLEPEERPRSGIAQQVLGTVLRETFLRFSYRAAIAAACLLATSLLLNGLAGLQP